MNAVAMTLKEHRAQFVVGARLEILEHWNTSQPGTIRTITKVQGNGYWYTDATGRRCWGDYVKRSQIEFHDDGSCTYRFDGDRAWRFRFI